MDGLSPEAEALAAKEGKTINAANAAVSAADKPRYSTVAVYSHNGDLTGEITGQGSLNKPYLVGPDVSASDFVATEGNVKVVLGKDIKNTTVTAAGPNGAELNLTVEINDLNGPVKVEKKHIVVTEPTPREGDQNMIHIGSNNIFLNDDHRGKVSLAIGDKKIEVGHDGQFTHPPEELQKQIETLMRTQAAAEKTAAVPQPKGAVR